MHDWNSFLERWNRAILDMPDIEEHDIPAQIRKLGWLGFSPATETEIAAAEARLGIALPPSYREFLLVSNGWHDTGTDIESILPIDEIDWLRDLNPDLIGIWMDSAGQEGWPDDPVEGVNYHHFAKTLAVSGGYEAYVLLNPEVISPDGEWEAWLFADWIPGAGRYDSFWDLLQDEYESLQMVNADETRRRQRDDPPEAVVTKLPGLLELLEDKRRLFATHADDMGINQASAEELVVLMDRVRKQTTGINDPTALCEILRALADKFDSEAAELEQEVKKASPSQSDLLSALTNPLKMMDNIMAQMEKMLGGLQFHGRGQGLRMAASMIRWYLNDV
jgi:cell wall assembly regulator SMI1